MASLNFHSTSYQWLVVAGAKAQYKGSGQINGAGNDGFMLTAIDGALPGGGGSDKFRIKIWDNNANGNIIYDNQVGASDKSDTAVPATVLGGGSIVIHSSNQLLNDAPIEGANLAPLTVQQLQPIEEEAIRLWVAAGAKPASFKGVDVQIVDLPRSGLGLAAANTIWLDKDAAGHGWFIDPTPADSSEFPATPGSAAYGKVDLLTVVAHELGHVLGYEDAGSDGLMAEYLGTGVRRVPAADAPAPSKNLQPSPLGPRFGLPPRNIDLALLSPPEEASPLSALPGEGAVPISDPMPRSGQPPVLLTAKETSALLPLPPAALGRAHSKRGFAA